MKLNFEMLVSNLLIPSLVGLLVGRYITTDQNIIISALIVIVASVAFFLFSEFLLYLIKHDSFERKIQGNWVLITESQNKNAMEHFPYSISSIKFDFIKKELKYSGFSFDENGKITAEWKSVFIEAREKENKITYVYEGHIFNELSDPTVGIGYVRFFSNSNGEYITGTGNYRGAANDYKPVYYKMIKLTPALCTELISKKDIMDTSDMKNLILKFKDREDLKP
jgi:hypothetical protein